MVFNLVPNPASDYLVIDNQSNESIHVKILNNIGQVNSIVELEKGNNRIDLNELNNGIYFILSDNYLLKTFVKFIYTIINDNGFRLTNDSHT